MASIKNIVIGSQWTYWETFEITRPELMSNMAMSLVGVFTMTLFFVHPFAALIISVNLMIIDILLIAWIPLCGMRLNSVTTVCMVMSVGIAVDYSAHLFHAFTSARGDNFRRARCAVTEMANPMFLGATSTFFGVIMLAFATNDSNRIFFKMVGATCFFGLLIGLIYLPAVLCFIGPTGHSHSTKVVPADDIQRKATLPGP